VDEVRNWIAVLGLIVFLLVAGCYQAHNGSGVQSGVATAQPTQAPAQITWLTDLNMAMQQAKQLNKPLLVDFYAHWCGHCMEMERTTWKDPAVIAASVNFVMVKQDIDKTPDEAQKYKVDGVPTMIFMDANGKVTHQQVGEIGAAELVKLMQPQQ
jgi:thiol:disulfide interchange protein